MVIQKGNQKALIIAVSNYERYEALDFCRRDGEGIYNLLNSLGYEISDKNKLVGHVIIFSLWGGSTSGYN